MISLRTPAVLLVALLMAGCAQDEQAYSKSYRSEATTAKKDCSPHQWSYGLREYTLLGIRAKQMVSSSGFILFSGLASLGDAEAWDKADKEMRFRADEVNRKLDALDRQADAWRASAGECFGEGDYGKKIADKYLWVKGMIAEQRKAVEDGFEMVLARNRAIEAERTNFERWRAKNRKHLVRLIGGMKLEIVRIGKRDIFGRPASKTVITVEATNTTSSKILKPRNQRVWGYEFGSDIGAQLPIGASLTDSFGNDYKLTGVTPGFLGNESGGIRPGQTVAFEVRFGDVPLESAKSVRLVVEAATFGQQVRTEFEIPSEAFYGPVTKR